MLDSIATPPWTPLSVKDMQDAILRLHSETARFGDERQTYVGASEVGDCPRRVADKKIHPEVHEITDPASAARMLGGHESEALAVAIVRRSHLGKWIRDTGSAQKEVVVKDAPMRVHADGTILKLQPPEGRSTALVLAPSGVLEEIPVDSLVGPGVLEIKSYGSGAFTQMRKKGLSRGYQDQVQSQLGALERQWALVVAVSREDTSRTLLFLVLFDADRWEYLKAKARTIMQHVEECRLPEPDSSCGYCDYCPLKDDCPAFAALDVVQGATFPEEVALEIDVLAEEYLELYPASKRLEEVKKSLAKIYSAHPVESYVTPEGAKTSRRSTSPRDNCDCKALKELYPAAYAATVTPTAASIWVAVSAPKGSK